MKATNLIVAISFLFGFQVHAETLDQKAELLSGGFFTPGVEAKVDTGAIIKDFVASGVFAPGSCKGKSVHTRFQYQEGLDEAAYEIEFTLRENLDNAKWKKRTVKSIRPVYEGSEFLGWSIDFCRSV